MTVIMTHLESQHDGFSGGGGTGGSGLCGVRVATRNQIYPVGTK